MGVKQSIIDLCICRVFTAIHSSNFNATHVQWFVSQKKKLSYGQNLKLVLNSVIDGVWLIKFWSPFTANRVTMEISDLIKKIITQWVFKSLTCQTWRSLIMHLDFGKVNTMLIIFSSPDWQLIGKTCLAPHGWVWADVGYKLQNWGMIFYKCSVSQQPENKNFNYHLSKIKIKSKLVIGYLKEQFQYLKELQVNILIKKISSMLQAGSMLVSLSNIFVLIMSQV